MADDIQFTHPWNHEHETHRRRFAKLPYDRDTMNKVRSDAGWCWFKRTARQLERRSSSPATDETPPRPPE
jgi:hypothetical protein